VFSAVSLSLVFINCRHICCQCLTSIGCLLLINAVIWLCHGSVGYSPASRREDPVSRPGNSTRVLWWTKSHWNMLYSEFLPVNIISLRLSIYILSGGWTLGPFVAAVRRQAHPNDMDNTAINEFDWNYLCFVAFRLLLFKWSTDDSAFPCLKLEVWHTSQTVCCSQTCFSHEFVECRFGIKSTYYSTSELYHTNSGKWFIQVPQALCSSTFSHSSLQHFCRLECQL
jgi:hypothetical protein